MNRPHHTGPLLMLLPYQKRWVFDESRFKFGLMARQVGKDFCAAAEGIRDCFLAERAGVKTTWLIAAPSERQSIEALEKWKEWMNAFKLVVADVREERDDPRNSQSLLRSTAITFPRGSRVIAVPGRPETVRGFSANVVLTEALFFEDFDRTWRAMFPSITNPLRGGPKKVRMLSTPNGVGSKGEMIWKTNYGRRPDSGISNVKSQPSHPASQGPADPGISNLNSQICNSASRAAQSQQPRERMIWSCHRVDIHDAVRDGLPLDPEELRLALDDPDGWAQEYELNFLDQASVLLPYELMAPCENPSATEQAANGFWGAGETNEPVVLGIDFGRKRDLTVCWALQVIGKDYLMTRDVLALEEMSTPEQVEALRPRIRRARRVCFDYTGAGVGMGDYLVKEFGEYHEGQSLGGKIELCSFTQPLKVEIFSKLRMEFERKTLGVPVSRLLREDLHTMQRVVVGGGVTYRASRSGDGHADYATALALAVRAASKRRQPFACSEVPRARADGYLRDPKYFPVIYDGGIPWLPLPPL